MTTNPMISPPAPVVAPTDLWGGLGARVRRSHPSEAAEARAGARHRVVVVGVPVVVAMEAVPHGVAPHGAAPPEAAAVIVAPRRLRSGAGVNGARGAGGDTAGRKRRARRGPWSHASTGAGGDNGIAKMWNRR
jgi:hypothetical protein